MGAESGRWNQEPPRHCGGSTLLFGHQLAADALPSRVAEEADVAVV
jgi:hypothetical protein